MKSILVIVVLFLCTRVVAQDSIRKLKISTAPNRTVYTSKSKQVTLTLEQQITQSVNRFLDSIVKTNDGHPFFIGKIKAGVSGILGDFWRDSRFAGTKQDEAFFVKCNAETMTQSDIAEGRLVLIIGYAKFKPAEFTTERFERILINKTPLQHANQF